MNRKQLRVWQVRLGRVTTRSGARSARTRGMEAVGEVQHRAKAKLRKAGPFWVSLPLLATPDIQSERDGTGDGGGTKMFIPDPMRTPRVRASGRMCGDAGPMPNLGFEGSSRIIPYELGSQGNSGGAKGVTS